MSCVMVPGAARFFRAHRPPSRRLQDFVTLRPYYSSTWGTCEVTQTLHQRFRMDWCDLLRNHCRDKE